MRTSSIDSGGNGHSRCHQHPARHQALGTAPQRRHAISAIVCPLLIGTVVIGRQTLWLAHMQVIIARHRRSRRSWQCCHWKRVGFAAASAGFTGSFTF